MKTIFKHTLLSLALLAGAFTAQAQVKIGSSPTTIGANSNLEVQAVNGKKVIVEKNVGTVQVENLPAGDILTNQIVTADPTGVLKQINSNQLVNSAVQISSMSTANNPSPQIVTSGVPQIIDFSQIDYDPQGLANTTTNRITVKKTGYYFYNIRTLLYAPVTNLWFTVHLMKNAPALSDPTYWASQIDWAPTASWSNGQANGEFSGVIFLNANDVLEIAGVACAGTGCSGNYTINRASFTIQYVGN